MTLYPDVLRRAQEEIDRVIGPDRLPTFEDRKDLPYMEALIKETLRWENVVPLGKLHTLHNEPIRHVEEHLSDVPHNTSEEDTYMGYRIPKGAAVIAKIWLDYLSYVHAVCVTYTVHIL